MTARTNRQKGHLGDISDFRLFAHTFPSLIRSTIIGQEQVQQQYTAELAAAAAAAVPVTFGSPVRSVRTSFASPQGETPGGAPAAPPPCPARTATGHHRCPSRPRTPSRVAAPPPAQACPPAKRKPDFLSNGLVAVRLVQKNKRDVGRGQGKSKVDTPALRKSVADASLTGTQTRLKSQPP